MMYLLDKLPVKSADRSFQRYYIYTSKDLEFCKEVLDFCLPNKGKVNGKTKRQWMNLIEVAISNSNAYVNMIEVPQ